MKIKEFWGELESINIFQDFFASIDKIFIFGGRLSASL